MKQIILALMLAVAGIGAAVAANPIREGNYGAQNETYIED